MIHINNLEDAGQLRGDPGLWAEVYGYLSVCAEEIRQYGDADDLDDHQFNFMILDEEDIAELARLGIPEESVRIDIFADGESRCMYRLVYPSEVFFIPGELMESCQLPFAVAGGAHGYR